MKTLLVIDMQVGSFDADPPQHDAEGTVDRINRLAAAIRTFGGSVVFVQHDGGPESDFNNMSRAQHDLSFGSGLPIYEPCDEAMAAGPGNAMLHERCRLLL